MQTQPSSTERPKDDFVWLNDSEEQMRAEDEQWAEFYSRRREHFVALREAALAEIKAGTTQPMFDDKGVFRVS